MSLMIRPGSSLGCWGECGLRDGLRLGDQAWLLRWAATPEVLVMCPPVGEPVGCCRGRWAGGSWHGAKEGQPVFSKPWVCRGPPLQPVPRQCPALHCTACERRWDLNRRLRCLSRREGFLEKVPLGVNGDRSREAARAGPAGGVRAPRGLRARLDGVGLLPSSPGCSWLLSAAQPLQRQNGNNRHH